MRAVEGCRIAEGRLTGGFPFVPQTKESPGVFDRKALERIDRDVRKELGRHRTPELLADAGLLRLIADRLDESILLLEESAAAGKSAAPLVDLAAVYLTRAARNGDPYDLIQSAEAVERALDRLPRSAEGAYNRALTLHRLNLQQPALAAWREYLRIDAGSGWSREAEQSIQVLSHPSESPWQEEQKHRLRLAVERGDEKTIRDLVTASPQDGREYAMNELLGSWGQGYSPGNASASLALSQAVSLGKALREMGGDQMVIAAIEFILRASPATRTVLAQAHFAYASGVRFQADLATEKAEPLLVQARDAFAQAGSPMLFWSESALAGIALSKDQRQVAESLFQSVAARIDPHLYPALFARVHWGLGLVHGREGQLSESLDHLNIALGTFEKISEARNQATMETMIAENLKYQGQPEEASRHLARALSVLGGSRAYRQLHNLLWNASDTLVKADHPRAALLFQTAGVDVARLSGQPFMLAEALLWRSQVLLSLGRYQPALEDLREARAYNDRGESQVSRERNTANIDIAEGEVLRRVDPRAALPVLDRALDLFQKQERPLDSVQAYLGRAQTNHRLGRVESSIEDLRAAIMLLEQQRGSITGPLSRGLFWETTQAVFDEMMELQVEGEYPPLRILETVERARSLETGCCHVTEGTLAKRLRELPPDTAVIEYALVHDHLLTWLLWHGRIQEVTRRVDSVDLTERAQALVADIRSRASAERDSAWLFKLLVAPVLDYVPSGTRLVLVPDRILNELPFAAFKNPGTGHYLIEDHVISMAPSLCAYLDILAHNRVRGDEPYNALLVSATNFDLKRFPALAQLPGAATEIEEARHFYRNPLILAGPQVTASRLLNEMDRHDVFVFAGHALYNPYSPLDSFLLLGSSSSSSFAARNMVGWQFSRLRLVVLSACSTLATSGNRGGSLAGLGRPFVGAGASAVLGSLWDTDDEAQRILLSDFHRHFVKTGDAAYALQGAQLALAAVAPSRWAGFQILGEIRNTR